MRPLLEAFSRLTCWMLEKDLLLHQRCGVLGNDRQWIPARCTHPRRGHVLKAYSFATVPKRVIILLSHQRYMLRQRVPVEFGLLDTWPRERIDSEFLA